MRYNRDIQEEYKFQHKYSIMATITQIDQQLELVSIIQVAQTKLIKNFSLLNKKMAKGNHLFLEAQEKTQQRFNETYELVKKIEQSFNERQNQQENRIKTLIERIVILETAKDQTQQELQQEKNISHKLNDALINTQLSFEEKIKEKEQQLDQISFKIEVLKNQHERLSVEINNRQTKQQAQKIAKDTEVLRDKNNFLQNQIKVANHKLQKMEILNQKAERLQAKKQVQITKEITQKIKNQLKLSSNSTNLSPPQLTTIINNHYHVQNKENSDPIAQRRNLVGEEGGLNLNTLIMGQNLLRGSSEQVIEKMGDKMKYFEIQLREINQNLKVLNKGFGTGKKGEPKQSTTQGITQKINQIKPELIKLWAKLDTVQDRLAFNQKKMQEKFKSINQLSIMIKENNISRLEEKFKNLQTELFTAIKQLKSKVEGKVGQTQYDKYCRAMQDKVKQIMQLIYLKSDKLQVKKALLFLQSKIKQIILVISQDQQNEKDALLTKKQIKCISCDKELDKFSGIISSPKGNWDNLPYKDHPPEILGRFGMTNFGSLAKKIKKLESKELPILNKKSANQSFQNSS